MAKSDKGKPAAADDFRPAEGFSPAAVFGDEENKFTPAHQPEGGADETDPRDAEILRLREELAALKATGGSTAGGTFTVSIKDGPTATIEAEPGETPEQAFMRALGIHSTPHRCEVSAAAAGARLGLHLPNGTVKPFAVG